MRIRMLLFLLIPAVVISYDCYDQKCQGTGASSSKYVSCDQSSKKCYRSTSTGYPYCYSYIGTQGGVTCSKSGYTCKSYSSTGKAYCSYPTTSYNCYNKKCQGTGSYLSKYVSCDQDYKYCLITSSGYPTCSSTVGTQGGITCGKSGYSYSCKSYSSSGKAYCSYSTTSYYDCYNQKCKGTGSYSSQYVSCDQSSKYCSTSSSGYPTCSSYSGTREGLTCGTFGYTCKYYSSSGKAYCTHDYTVMVSLIASGIVFIMVVCCCCCCCCCYRRRKMRRQQTTVAAPAPAPTVMQNINVAPTPDPAPQYPPPQQGFYPPGQQPPAPHYPQYPQQPQYPAAPGYPPPTAGYQAPPSPYQPGPGNQAPPSPYQPGPGAPPPAYPSNPDFKA